MEGGFFSTGGLLLQLSYALLIAAVLSTRRLPRLFIALSAAAALAYAIGWSGDPVAMIWMGLLLVCCLAVFGRDLIEQRLVRFNAEEELMLAGFLKGMPRNTARHLVDHGVWLHGTIGDELTREGLPVQRVLFLAHGEALVMSEGRQVATCRKGDLVGEASVLSGDPATATVVLAGPARLWCIDAQVLRSLMETDPELAHRIERSFAHAVRDKLHASNKTIAAAGGVA